MKRTVILSTNNNPDYLNYLPYTQMAWNKLGWNTFTFCLGVKHLDQYQDDKNTVFAIGDYSDLGFKEATIVQVIRLLAYEYVNGLIMTGDVDMIPMSNYWNPDPDKITVYGIDLTGDEQIPMCYVAMDSEKWQQVIPEFSLLELLGKYPQAKSEDFQDWWFVDQRILTKRILPVDFVRVDRGVVNNLAKGRVDRANWKATMDNPGIKIDAHMPRPFDPAIAENILSLVKA